MNKIILSMIILLICNCLVSERQECFMREADKIGQCKDGIFFIHWMTQKNIKIICLMQLYLLVCRNMKLIENAKVNQI